MTTQFYNATIAMLNEIQNPVLIKPYQDSLIIEGKYNEYQLSAIFDKTQYPIILNVVLLNPETLDGMTFTSNSVEWFAPVTKLTGSIKYPMQSEPTPLLTRYSVSLSNIYPCLDGDPELLYPRLAMMDKAENQIQFKQETAELLETIVSNYVQENIDALTPTQTETLDNMIKELKAIYKVGWLYE